MSWTDTDGFIHFEQWTEDSVPPDLIDRMFPYRKLPFGHPATPVPWPTLIRIHSTDGHDAEAEQMTNALNWVLSETPIRLKASEIFGDASLDSSDFAQT